MELEILQGRKKTVVSCEEGLLLKDILLNNHIIVDMPCGGNGTCGGCLVQYETGAPEPVLEEREAVSAAQLKRGFRLACVSRPSDGARIKIIKKDRRFEAVTNFRRTGSQRESAGGIAIDIGTTTIAFALIQGGKTVYFWSKKNSQSALGADVISRIGNACEGKGEVLRELVQKDLAEGIDRLAKRAGDVMEKIAIAGNTTMLHLLLGYSCEGLGSAPFSPVSLEAEQRTLAEVAPDSTLLPQETEVFIFPGFSAFLGGDIAAGLLYTRAWDWEDNTLFIDLGTNGEMVFGTKEKLFMVSAAAGPAFEGGSLSCGMGSTEGAICSVDFSHAAPKIKTIGGRRPEGICGTGVVEALYGMRKNHYIDASGLLREPYFTEGFPLYENRGPLGKMLSEHEAGTISITQKDIREIQMAKAAIRTGINILLEKAGCKSDEVKRCYLAGGFGYRLDLHKAAGIGLIPEELEERTEAVGNASLGGAAEVLLEPDFEQTRARLGQLKAAAQEITLAEEEAFGEQYMEFMFF